MFNFRVSLIILAITGYFVARVILSSTQKPKPAVSVYEYQVRFNTRE